MATAKYQEYRPLSCPDRDRGGRHQWIETFS